jgi:alpha-beta hydrolase superfamily lysophospholipase
MTKDQLTVKIKRLLFILLLPTIMTACMPNIHPAGIAISSGQLLNRAFVAPDGTKLPLKSWQPLAPQEAKAVIIALHGFNDYSQFFQQPGLFFSQHSTASYAYDQRGFGESSTRGLWAGVDTYTSDLACFIQLIKNRHPTIPLYLLGESMGGAIIISTLSQSPLLPVDGIILAAPAVWARQTMPWYQNALLWTLSHTVPWMTLTGNGLEIKPSDNIEMLIALGKDPLVIKETRVEAIYGLVNLMDHALLSADLISTNTLLLYGEKDEIIPKQPTYQFLKKLTASTPNNHLIAFYKNGYHMLLRDLQAPILWNDVNIWMDSFTSSLPSGADNRALELLDHRK